MQRAIQASLSTLHSSTRTSSSDGASDFAQAVAASIASHNDEALQSAIKASAMTDDDALLMEAIAASLLSSKTAGVHESQLQTALAASRLEAGHQKEDSELDQAIAKSTETFQAEKTARLARLAEEASF